MKIGIISDTHDNIRNFEKAITIFNQARVELVFHCGDWSSFFMLDYCEKLNYQIISVLGNNDKDFLPLLHNQKGKVSFEGYCIEKKLDERVIAVCHGDSESLLTSLLSCQKYDIVFSGHTHIASIKKVKNTLHLNPGSAGFPRKRLPSIAIYETKTNKGEIIWL